MRFSLPTSFAGNSEVSENEQTFATQRLDAPLRFFNFVVQPPPYDDNVCPPRSAKATAVAAPVPLGPPVIRATEGNRGLLFTLPETDNN